MRSRSTIRRPPSPSASPALEPSSPSAERSAALGGGRPALVEAARRLWHWRHFDVVALGLLVVVIAILNELWITTETRPPHWDMARHLGDSLVYYHSFSLSHPFQWLETYLFYAPLTYWVTDIFYGLFGVGTPTAIFSNIVFIAVLAFSTYGIGKRLWTRRVGLLATVFVLASPVIVSNFKEYMLDAPLTAMVALALYLLIRSETFARRWPSLLFGIVCGLGLLTKWTFPVFVALPVAVAVLAAIARTVRTRSVGSLLNVVGAGLLAFAVCGLWYVHNWAQLHHDLSHFAGVAGAIKGSPPVASGASIGFYFWTLINYQLFAIPFVLFVIGIVFVFARREDAMRNLMPALLILGTYTILTLVRNKDVRYTLPMLPAVAVIATSWFEYLRPRARRILSAGLAAYGAVVFLAISFGTSLLPTNAAIGTGGVSPGFTVFAQQGYIIGPPSNEHWYQQQVFQQIAHSGGAPTFFFSGADSIWFNTWGTRYYMLLYNLSWVATPAQANYLVYRDVPNPEVPSGFGRVGTWTLPDGEPLYLYKRFL
jgi:4-amino-4-deoxy-L-arabinose transferase-like glycosyltransferase